MNSLTKKLGELQFSESKTGYENSEMPKHSNSELLEENSCAFNTPKMRKKNNEKAYQKRIDKKRQRKLHYQYTLMRQLIKKTKATNVDELMKNLNENCLCIMHAECGKDWFTIASNILLN